MPGVYEEELTLRLLSRTRLHIRGNITPLFPKNMGVCQNRYYGEIDETIELPEPAEPHLLQAQCVNGLLHISYPRLMEHILFRKNLKSRLTGGPAVCTLSPYNEKMRVLRTWLSPPSVCRV